MLIPKAGTALATPAMLERHETTQCACTVILSGFFESCLKDIAQRCAAEINERHVAFSSLPASVRRAHYERGGSVLSLKASGRTKGVWIAASEANLVNRLYSVQCGPPYELIWEAFADTKSNPTLGVVEEIAQLLGVSHAGSSIAFAAGMSHATLQTRLTAFIQIRNACAHTGSAPRVPTTLEVRGFCDLVASTCEALVLVLEKRLGEAPFGVNINSASCSDLEAVPQLGATRSSAIVAERARHGPFRDLSDLLRVSGIGPSLLRILQSWVHV